MAVKKCSIMPKHGEHVMSCANVETVKPHKKNPGIAGAVSVPGTSAARKRRRAVDLLNREPASL